MTRYALLTSLMLALGLIERQFVLVPSVPGIRLGLSNTVLLYAVVLMGARSAWLLMALKVALGGLLYAGLSGMLYSLAGGVLSVAAMLAAVRLKNIGFVGVSVAGAVTHMTGQVLMSRLLLGTWAAAAQAPILLVAAVVTGVVTGIAASAACRGVAQGDKEIRDRMEALGLLGSVSQRGERGRDK